jgi:alkanesulfonate monooxygenase SsuD/methylene tetrahydromethanopterin reductase-like flavin-dependent oxidoreductase (luciferase family)
MNAFYPDNFDEAQQRGFGIAGTAATVRDGLLRQLAEAQNNYLVCRFAFGDMSLDESLRSVELFARQVMPALDAATP